MRRILILGLLCAVGTAVVTAEFARASDYSGKLKLGYTILDEEGNFAVNQPTYNTYEGLGVSLNDFRYRFDDGTRLSANLQNVTLNNRNLRAGLTRTGRFGLSAYSNQYRRTYNFAGSEFTRRSQSGGDLWVEPSPYVRFFGGLGVTMKKGSFRELYEPDPLLSLGAVDYTNTRYHGGAQVKYQRASLTAEYRGSSFTDDLDDTYDRQSQRFKVSGSMPLRRWRNVWLNAGFQHFENRLKNLGDTLSANTVWGGGRIFLKDGISGRYSFIWDRATRTGDVTATDNVTHAVTLGKTWRGQAGLTVGYRNQANDDAFDEIKTNSFFASGWTSPGPKVTLRADFGTSSKDDVEATTLTGDQDLTRLGASITIRHDYGRLRVKAENRAKNNDDIGSKVDFTRFGADGTLAEGRYGEISASYSFVQGKYENAQGTFEFRDHIVSGEALTRAYQGAKVGFGGTYLRTLEGLDIERFSVSFLGRYTPPSQPRYTIEVVYTAHNFDDFDNANMAVLYNQYYTANIVEINLITELGR
jgi:hypothetical protein